MHVSHDGPMLAYPRASMVLIDIHDMLLVLTGNEPANFIPASAAGATSVGQVRRGRTRPSKNVAQ